MKKALRKLTTLTILATAILGTPALLRAADTDTNAAAASDQSGPTKFYGPVTAVDTNAMTFAVGDQTFTITAESQITKSNQPATLADAVVGEPARGSYIKGADGKLDITKVRFGKKVGGKGGGKAGGRKHKKAEMTETNAPAVAPDSQ